MGIRHNIQENFLDNPIAWREHIMLFRQRGKWFWRITYALTLLIIIVPVFFYWSRYLRESVEFTASVLLMVNIFAYPLVVVRAIMTVNEGIARERRSKTWDLLMLTGVSTWRVVVGKWLGTLRFLMRDFIWLFILRVTVFFWFAFRDVVSYRWSTGETSIHFEAFSLNQFMIAVGLITLFTVLEMLFSSALGISTAFFNWKARTGGGVAMGIRIGLAIGMLLGTLYFAGYFRLDPDLRPEYEDHVDQFLGTFSTTFIDNGMLHTARITIEGDYLDEQETQAIQTALLLNALLYLVLTGVALEVARTVAHRVGVNDPGAPLLKLKKKNSIDAPIIQPIAPAVEHTIAIPSGASNVFELQEPTTYRTEVYHYQRRLGRMYLRVTKGSEPTYIQLSNVRYIEAPSAWSGADFRTATQSEYEAFIAEKHLQINHLAEESMRLYLLDGAMPVRIVAGTAQIVNELPKDI